MRVKRGDAAKPKPSLTALGVCLLSLFVAALFVSGCAKQGAKQEEEQYQGPPPEEEGSGIPSELQYTKPEGNIVEITASGFNPETLQVEQGSAVTFVNKDTTQHWPASAKHPLHSAYPDRGGCIGSKFDSCEPLDPNQNFTFTFNHKGTWEYHDHWKPGLTGTVVVE